MRRLQSASGNYADACPRYRAPRLRVRALLGAGIVLTAAASAGNAQRPVSNMNPMKFEVASVKVDDSSVGRGDLVLGAQRLTWRGATIKRMICEAYKVQYAQVAGVPSWGDTERYEVQATMERASSRDEVREMLKGLLAERFRLAVHTETKRLPVYVLTVAKGGLKLKKVSPEHQNGSLLRDPGINRFTRQASMQQFAGLLSQMITGPIFNGYTRRMEPREDLPAMVIDQTGLNGVYEIDLNLNATGDEDFASTLVGAVDALGLKLNLQRMPVEIIAVDQVQRIPTAN